MPKIIADITMSLDGYVTGLGADEQHGLGDAPELHTWVTEQDAVDTEILERATAQSGAVVMGRRLFDIVDGPGGWNEDMGYGADQTLGRRRSALLRLMDRNRARRASSEAVGTLFPVAVVVGPLRRRRHPVRRCLVARRRSIWGRPNGSVALGHARVRGRQWWDAAISCSSGTRSAELCVRRVPVPSRDHRPRGALVPAVRFVVSRCRGALGRAWD
jgi:hypothetical protein